MKKTKHFILLLLVMCMVMGVMVSCGSSETESEPTSLVTVAAGTYRTEADLKDVQDYVHIDEEVTVPVGSTTADIANSIECDTSEINSVSFSFNHVNTSEPGEYTGTVVVNVSPDLAKKIVKKIDVPDDAEDVSLQVEFPVVVVEE